MSPLSFISPSSCLSLFFSLSFAGLSPTFSFSLLLPFCAFQICGHDNKSKLNTLDNADTETISAFRYRLYRLFSLPHNTLVAMWLPAKITSSCHTCMSIELFYIGMPVVRTDWRVFGHLTTKIYRMHRLPNNITLGTPLRPPRARESCALKIGYKRRYRNSPQNNNSQNKHANTNAVLLHVQLETGTLYQQEPVGAYIWTSLY